MLSTTLLTLSGLVSFSTAQYVLQDDYSTDSFFSMFDFFTDADPTKGYVTYVDQSTASSANLISTDSGSVYMGVDYTNVASGSGRQSVRITSKNSYNTGLVILDLAHMPGSVCGTWPAFWMVGPDWPNNGEIDIIEGVNSQKSNHMALHTSDGCTLTNATISYTGQMTSSNCYVKAPGQDVNAGCGIGSSATTSYGDGFNNANGGVYATEITSDGISIWHFPRASIPSDITSGSPDPSGWGEASASFSGDCDFSSHFKSMQIVFDTTFCGDWAGNVWSSDATCSAQASTCQDYVQNNPSDFQDSFWTVNSLKVYSGSSSSYAEEEYEGDSDQTTVSESVSVYASYSLPTEGASIAIDVTVAGTTESVSASTETSTPANNRGTWGWGRGGRASWTHVNNAGKFVIQPTATALESALESALGSALEPALGSVPVQTQDTAASAPEVGIAEENSTVNEIPGIEDDRTQGDYDVSKNVHEHIIKHRKSLPAIVSEGYEPKGKYIELDGLKTYVTGPSDADTAVFLIFDIFGFFPQTLQGADILAAPDNKGRRKQVFIPDFWEGDPADISWLPPDTEEKKEAFNSWFGTKASPPKHLPRVPGLLDAAEKLNPKIKSWGMVGYCWGGKMVSLIAGRDTRFKAGVQTSPALYDLADAPKVKIPMLLLPSKDEPREDWEKYRDALTVPNKLVYFGDQIHGWMSARGDLKDPAVKKDYERGYQLTVDFLAEHL
ncbi:hypothetical protein DV738_g5121, partial [Chaetothyriales sp. CBS 135597]